METHHSHLGDIFNFMRGKMPDGTYDYGRSLIRIAMMAGIPTVIASQIAASNGFTLDRLMNSQQLTAETLQTNQPIVILTQASLSP